MQKREFRNNPQHPDAPNCARRSGTHVYTGSEFKGAPPPPLTVAPTCRYPSPSAVTVTPTVHFPQWAKVPTVSLSGARHRQPPPAPTSTNSTTAQTCIGNR
ncbi:hypothetical protein V6N13_023792 [Hibiscus sabdariffa]|uniref:Uncharacterized protein n=1 Tax=Hibiscus sabdariffa TaxID=183260 RepID=A0ABR2PMU0_9ROSI